MDEGGWPALSGDARWRVVEAGVEERARRCCDQAERPLGVTLVDHPDMVGQRRQQRMLGPERPPIGAEVKFAVGMAEAVQEMAGGKRRATIEPASFRETVDAGQPAHLQR